MLLGWLSNLVRSEIPRSTEPQGDPVVGRLDVAARASAQVGTGRYRLGKGGRRPLAPSPLDAAGLCDCSGFAAWAMGLDRYQPGRIEGDWISTTSVYRDATGPHRLFVTVALEEARPGDLVVYPSTYRAGVRTGIGHVGVVVGVSGGWSGLAVVDCAARKGAAIGRRTGELWGRKGGVVARRAG